MYWINISNEMRKRAEQLLVSNEMSMTHYLTRSYVKMCDSLLHQHHLLTVFEKYFLFIFMCLCTQLSHISLTSTRVKIYLFYFIVFPYTKISNYFSALFITSCIKFKVYSSSFRLSAGNWYKTDVEEQFNYA